MSPLSSSDFDPIRAMDERHAAQRAAELAAAEEQNRESARRTEVARAERAADAELTAIDLQNRFQAHSARLSSPEAEKLGGRSAEADRLLEAQYDLTDAEFEELADEQGYDVKKRK